MPYANWGEKISFGNDFIFKLKEKGEKVQFRILGKPYFEGKHFIKFSDGTFSANDCSRVMEGQACATCEKYFGLMKEAKTMSDTEAKITKKEANNFRAAIIYYFPIIDRATHKFRVFRTTQGVRTKLELEVAEGVKILDKDWTLTRTEVTGGDYYKLGKVDSSETLPLTQEELAEVEKSKKVPLSTMITGKPIAEEGGSIEFEQVTKERSADKPEMSLAEEVAEDLPF